MRPLEIRRIPASSPCMTGVLIYDCPSCAVSCSVTPDLVCLNVVCSNCNQEFTATPPDSASNFQLPEMIPCFKSGKFELPQNYLSKLISDGELRKLEKLAVN
jgi:hypothetical protein